MKRFKYHLNVLLTLPFLYIIFLIIAINNWSTNGLKAVFTIASIFTVVIILIQLALEFFGTDIVISTDYLIIGKEKIKSHSMEKAEFKSMFIPRGEGEGIQLVFERNPEPNEYVLVS